jgi:hypothetical protein
VQRLFHFNPLKPSGNCMYHRLGGVVVSVLATGPKDRGFKPGQGNGSLRAIKSAGHLSSDGK